MCGIAGFFDEAVGTSERSMAISGMTNALFHRGPDSSGIWVDENSGLALGHRRLSIVDLSEAGHQPMMSASERYVMVFNGEVYNHLDIRNELNSEATGFIWRGHSDTETILAGFEAWGIEPTLRKMVGMFAIALWDRHARELLLVRDRMGEKPLYFGWNAGVFFFGSELKAFKQHPSFSGEVDRGSLSLLLRHSCVPAPYSIYVGISKLRPGHYARFTCIDGKLSGEEQRSYWSLNNVVKRGIQNPFSGNALEAVDALEDQLCASVSAQMQADVPLGAFLSGGVDSSTVVALMQKQSNRPAHTFSIGFDSKGLDEAAYAKAVSKHLGTRHTELYVSPDDALAVVPSLPDIYCEPFSDSSQIPMHLVSKLARNDVAVALSGDGGDELFGGYNRYLTARKLWERGQNLPAPIRRALVKLLKRVPARLWDSLFELARPVTPASLRVSEPGDKIQKLANVLGTESEAQYFQQLVSHWENPSEVVLHSTEPATLITDQSSWPEADCLEHWMMALDAQTFMSDDVLTKVDRAAMACSLESRVPMLDHRVVELAWTMPLEFKIKDGKGKWMLREVLYRHVPKGLIDRPKMGFATPLDAWLRGPLREWVDALLSESRLIREGFFDPLPVRRMWHEHLSGKKNWQHHLWDVLMFQAWLENQ